MTIFYYTSTGNNLYIAKSIGGTLHAIPQILKNGPFFFEDDAIGIIFPCYAFATPEIVKDFLSKVHLKSDYIFAIVSYGNIAGGVLWDFEKACRAHDISLAYTNQLLMIDNALDIFDIDKQRQKLPEKRIDENLAIIVEDIARRKHSQKKTTGPQKTMTLLVKNGYALLSDGNIGKKFKIEDTCNQCGICAKVCPYGNITVTDRPNFSDHCAKCFACTNHCPQNAIRIPHEKSRARFRNEHVTLKEMIDANDITR